MPDTVHLIFRNANARELKRGNYIPSAVRSVMTGHFFRNPNGYVEIHYQDRERFAFTSTQASHIADQLGLPSA